MTQAPWQAPGTLNARKHLSADALFSLVRGRIEQIAQTQAPDRPGPLADALTGALAMFALKDPSLLAFEDRRHDPNLQRVFGIHNVPCDTHMRTLLDPVPPESLRPLFKRIFSQLQRGNALESLVFEQGAYLLSIDGTGYFSSSKIHCDSCLIKKGKSGKVTSHHQMMGAVIVHPDHREVIPLMPEPILRQDGETKNDCERNATKRLLEKVRHDHPHLKLIVLADGLSSTAPNIRQLQALAMRFILGAKPGDHAYLFKQVQAALEQGRGEQWEFEDPQSGNHYRIGIVNQVPLNQSNEDLLVNFLEVWETSCGGQKVQHFSWVTDLELRRDNAMKVMRGGRARWKVENETFNTLKNQGYHYEHNFGHGEKYLSVVFALLMMLAFLIDQVQQLCCPLFKAAWARAGSKRALWEKLRGFFENFTLETMAEVWRAIALGYEKPRPHLLADTS